MNDFYLNDLRRLFYTESLELIRNCSDDFWNLDDCISEHLDIINSNPNIRTMYSRRGKNRYGVGLESYLTICFSQSIEHQLKEGIIPALSSRFTSTKYCEFKFYVEMPKVQIEEKEGDPCLEYINHPDYWNVHHLKIELRGGFANSHDVFWTILSESLSKLA